MNVASLPQSVTKRAWSRTLATDASTSGLDSSPDFRGMAWAMPLSAVLLVLFGMIPIGFGNDTISFRPASRPTDD